MTPAEHRNSRFFSRTCWLRLAEIYAAIESREAGRREDETVLVQFTFSDTGIGMRPESLEHIFDTFTREQGSRVDRTEGSGLGMAITKRIINSLDGEIVVPSELGMGTMFQITLPLVVATTPELPLDFLRLTPKLAVF